MEFKPYNPAEIEPKWQKHWDDNQTRSEEQHV